MGVGERKVSRLTSRVAVKPKTKKGVTKQSNAVTSNGVTRKRVTG